jgi:hypothetical protein
MNPETAPLKLPAPGAWNNGLMDGGEMERSAGRPHSSTIHESISPPARLVRRRGCIAVGKAEIALLNETCGSAAASAKAVWIALLILANDRQTGSFTTTANVIKSLAGLSHKTTKVMLCRLEDLAFLKIERHYNPATRQNDPSDFTLLRSGNKYPTPSGNYYPRGGVSDEAHDLPGSEKESAIACHKKRSGQRRQRPGAGAPASAAPQLSRQPGVW